MKHEEIRKIEKRLVRHLIRVMKLNGWNIKFIYDSEENVKVSTEKEAMDVVFGLDECHIHFTNGKFTHWVYIVLGNDGWDAICDNSYNGVKGADDFEDVMAIVEKYVDVLCTDCGF